VTRLSANNVDPGRNPRNVEFAFAGTFELEVFNTIYQIKSNAIGSDGVPIKFLRIILTHILPYVTHIFNSILTTSSFPMTWKLSKVMPVAKNNDSSGLSDYRPISIVPALSKAEDIIMRKQMTTYNDSNRASVLIMAQPLLSWKSRTICSWPARRDLVLLNVYKAFDSVDHLLLCSKLSRQYNFSTSAFTRIMSYISGRRQCV
jgi:hypothetical protein